LLREVFTPPPLDVSYYSAQGSKEPYQLCVPSGVEVPSDWEAKSATKAFKRYWSPHLRSKVEELRDLNDQLSGVRGGGGADVRKRSFEVTSRLL
jgi:hypothetical protein